ncbi:serine/threonine protein kinase [Metallosphaera tengchongensis]|uniref:Serine/threonine protein kinase n=1 Tax=Metallosphaera tengchongensis TaxID=1532350 RepID=A0A6N0NVH8_9CREN|nr:serine/threonine-protein kinase [Metallosphaera tengchongensis]QKR00732.1 serine/threonine protein kinase [Metallosphaera tengchongensis]
MSSSSSDKGKRLVAFIAVFSFIFTTLYYLVSGLLPAIANGLTRGDLFNSVLSVVNSKNSPIIYSSTVVDSNGVVKLSLIVYAVFENPVSVLNLAILGLPHVPGGGTLLFGGGLVNLISGGIFAYFYRRSKGVLISSISLISNSIIQAFITSRISSDPPFYSLFSMSEALLFVVGQVIAGTELYRENKVKAILVSFPFFSLLNILGFGWLISDAFNGAQTHSSGAQQYVPPSTTQNYNDYDALVGALRNGDSAEARMYISELQADGFAIEDILDQLVNDGECRGAIWVMDNYTLDFGKLKDSSVVDCIVEARRVPKSVVSLLESLDKTSVENALRLAKFIYYNTNLSDSRRDKAEEILVKHSVIQRGNPPASPQPKPGSTMPTLDRWDPNLWVGKEVYGYTIERVLGVGGTSYVLLAKTGDEQYAIKVPILSYSPTQATKVSSLTFQDIYKESSNLQRLSEHGNVVRIFGMFLDMNLLKRVERGEVAYYLSNPPAIVMEYMGGGSLSTLVNEDTVFFSTRWVDVLRTVFLKVGKALDYLHKSGYVHLDVKPQNIFFSRPLGGTGEEVYDSLVKGHAEVKLGDLGSARRAGERVTQYTAQYCPVDQVKAMVLGKADPSMDVYSFGASLYTALTRRYFNPQELVKLMDDAVDDYARKGSSFLSILREAEEKYARYYNGELRTSLSSYPDNLREVILLATDPDPNKRPRMGYIISLL